MVHPLYIREHHHRAIHYFCRAISRDEARYPDGGKFTPKRFLDADEMLSDDGPADFVLGGEYVQVGGHHGQSMNNPLTSKPLCRYQAVTLRMPPSGAPS